MNKINIYKTLSTKIVVLVGLIISITGLVWFSDVAMAADKYPAQYNVGTVVEKSDGTYTVDVQRIRFANEALKSGSVTYDNWQQITLTKKPNSGGSYVGIDSNGITWSYTDGVVNGSGNAGVKLESSTVKRTAVSERVYTAMQRHLAQGKSREDAEYWAKAEVASEDYNNNKDNPSPGGTTPGGTTPGGTTPGGGDCGVQGGTSVIKCGDGDPLQEMILYFTNFFFAGVGVVSIIGIIIGGVVYITAGGDASKTKQGITYITNAVIALVVFIFLFMLLNFLVPGGFFNNAGFEMEPPSPNIDNIDPEDHQTCNGPNCYSPY